MLYDCSELYKKDWLDECMQALALHYLLCLKLLMFSFFAAQDIEEAG